MLICSKFIISDELYIDLGSEYLRQVWVCMIARAIFPFLMAQEITVETTIFNHIIYNSQKARWCGVWVWNCNVSVLIVYVTTSSRNVQDISLPLTWQHFVFHNLILLLQVLGYSKRNTTSNDFTKKVSFLLLIASGCLSFNLLLSHITHAHFS